MDLLSGEREMYGLEMVESSNRLARGTIYVMLYRMEDKGYVTSRRVRDENASGLPKRVYAITEWGKRVLEIARGAEEAFQAAAAMAPVLDQPGERPGFNYRFLTIR
jgi:DNA-binding PadR family transcriptional regulator